MSVRFEFDKGGKWLTQHHGDAILWLGGAREIVSWKALQAELVVPRKLPDGLLEVLLARQTKPNCFLLEIATHPDQRIYEQVLADIALVYADRGELPEVLVLVLHPKGNVQLTGSVELVSPVGWTQWKASWRVVELWKMSAEELLSREEPGLVPWVPLTHIDGPPEPVIRRCREIIDQKARADQHADLLAVTEIFTGLRYNEPQLLMLLGGKAMMIESPVLRDFLAEELHKGIFSVLEERFVAIPEDIRSLVKTITDRDRLHEVLRLAARCQSLDEFRKHLAP